MSRLYSEIVGRLRQCARWSGGLFACLLLGSIGSGRLLSAQDTMLPAPGANRLVGVVTDTLGNALPEVFVVITKLHRQTRTRSDGSFRFDSVPPGTYELTARSMGLIAGVSTAVVGAEGGSVVIQMIRIGTVLQARITVAERGGLSGVIGDTNYRALADVKVAVMGTGYHAETDSSGAFFIPLKPGSYMMQLKREGFAHQLVSVTVPNDAGRRIAAWMTPQSGRENVMEAVRLFDLNQRLMRVSAASSKFFTRDVLEQQNIPDLQALAQRWANGRITAGCLVTIDGSNVKVPLSTLTTDELEFVELYQASQIGGTTRGVKSISGNRAKSATPPGYAQPAVSGECGNLSLIAWLRK